MHRCHHLPPPSHSCQTPYSLCLFVKGQYHDTLTFDTREELDEVVAYAEVIKRRRRERERPITVDAFPSFMRALGDEVTNALPPFSPIKTKRTPEMIIQDGLKVNDRYVVIERCDAL